MIMSDIKKYFIERRTVSLDAISLHFNVEPDAMRGMLEHWQRKGKLNKLNLDSKCSGCCKTGCSPGSIEFYKWIG